MFSKNPSFKIFQCWEPVCVHSGREYQKEHGCQFFRFCFKFYKLLVCNFNLQTIDTYLLDFYKQYSFILSNFFKLRKN